MRANGFRSAEGMTLGASLKIQPPANAGGQSLITGHVILNHFVLDDEGNVCLMSPSDLPAMLDAINELKRELDELASHAALWFTDNVTLRSAGIPQVSCTDKNYCGGLSKGDGGNLGTPSPPHPHNAEIIPFRPTQLIPPTSPQSQSHMLKLRPQ